MSLVSSSSLSYTRRKCMFQMNTVNGCLASYEKKLFLQFSCCECLMCVFNKGGDSHDGLHIISVSTLTLSIFLT